MYLSKLALHGFKSFAQPTSLTFDPGVTAIVGPNGCGKSNIVDAVRWVIGEQRPTALRSEKMENVIFNGTAQRKPLGMAEVQLTVENNRGVLPTEYTEVTLGRRLYRDGKSEYLLNGVQCRLKDITDLFMDTGMGADAYSVIELKMIEEILSDNTQDRRRLFEEAAGITRYKMRRRQALRKLEQTEADVERIRDLTDEIGTTVRRLKQQAEKAETHRALATLLHARELALARTEHARLAARQAALADAAATHAAEAARLETAQAEAERRLQAHREALETRTEALADARDARQQHRSRIRELAAEERLAEERVERAERDRDRAAAAAAEAAARRAELADTIARLESALAQAAPAAEAAAAARAEAVAARDATRAEAETLRAEARTLRRQEQQADDARTRHRRAADKLASRLDARADELDRTEAQRDALAADADDLDARVAAAEVRADDAAAARAEAEAALDDAEAEEAARRAALDAATDALREAERRRDAAAAEVDLLESLVASYDEFSDAVQFLAADADAFPDADAPLTTVADVLACDDDLRLALDAALGDLAGCVVVPTAAAAAHAVARLRDAEEGRATFVVLDRLPAAPPSATGAPPALGGGDGLAAGALRTHVRTAAPRYDALADALLRGVYLADTLEAAQALAQAAAAKATRGEGAPGEGAPGEGTPGEGAPARPAVRVVARSGEWAAAPALLRGGSAAAAASPVASRLGRREQLDAARAEHARLADAAEGRARARAACREALAALDVAARTAALREAEAAARDAAQALDRARYERATLDERRADLARRIEELEAALDDGQAERATLEARARDAEAERDTLRRRRNAAEDALDAAEQAERDALDAFSEANVAAVEARNRRDNLRRDLDRARTQHEAVNARRAGQADEAERLAAVIDDAAAARTARTERLAAARAGEDAYDDAVDNARAAVADAKAAIATAEDDLRTLRQAAAEAVRRANDAQVRLAEVQTRLGDLVATIRADFGVFLGAPRLAHVPAPPATAPALDAATLRHATLASPTDTRADAEDDAEDDLAGLDGVAGLSEEALRDEVQTLRRKLARLGDVNPLALEAYREEKERLDFLQTQQDDLERAEATLQETIREINTTAAERFFATFDAIQAHFERIVADLFGAGAAAALELDDPDDPLDTSIEIMAQPRGKRPSTLAQLSSGEKTLTATALLFAIYLVKPSPFCILDEVDAPLDDANVERFMRLVRRFETDTQFILVTHNQRTMALADRMYGITMEEQGVSKLVGVAFDEAVAMAS